MSLILKSNSKYKSISSLDIIYGYVKNVRIKPNQKIPKIGTVQISDYQIIKV
jgi:hypothetical protein